MAAHVCRFQTVRFAPGKRRHFVVQRLPRAETALRTRTTTHQCASATSMSLALLAETSVHEEPVREYRTPGSVRGLSGNWQSYRERTTILR